ncbi:hypothetical protein J3R82DRAFT_8987 [Butyriboletus roseoflavus]|nr:hypothetical protein J3R82DRAFT_8987 [Butyriboletus roseoflavus]
MQPQCPLCRDAFSPWGIRKLHVDTNDVPLQVQRVLDDIAKTVDGGVTVEELQRVTDQCTNNYRNTQSDDLHTPLGVSYLLLSTLLEVQKKLLLQTDQLSELAAAKDHICDRLTCELTIRATQEPELGRSAVQRERDCAEKRGKCPSGIRSDERSLEMVRTSQQPLFDYVLIRDWCACSKVGLVKQKYQSLLEELDELCSTTQSATHGRTGSASDTTISRHAVVASGSSRMKTMLDEVVSLYAFQLWPHFILVFRVIKVSLGGFLFLHAFVVVLQLCVR